MKYVAWLWNNVVIWAALGVTTSFAVVGVIAVIAGPHLRCLVVP